MPFKKSSGQSSSSAFKFDLGFGTASPLDDSVSTLRASARILADVAGVLSKFPFVKPLAAVTVIMCEIFENVKSNDEGWDALAKRAVSVILTVMYKRQEDPTSLPPALSTHCDQLIVKLEAVRTKMNQLSNRNWMKKVLRNSTDKDLQIDFERFLDQACVIFQIQTLMDIDMRITGVQAMLKQLEDKLTSFEAKLDDVQASAIKFGERQILNCLSNISGVQYNPGQVCAPGTRFGILRDIEIWASNFSPPLVASLRGKAGIGKSTVAHTVAARFHGARCLAASYFFSRDAAMSRPLKNLFPELSRQLAFRLPPYRRALCASLELDEIPIFPQQQLSKLLIEPLRASLHADTMTQPWIIVLDALDECEDDIRGCILLLTEAIAEFQGKLKLVLTSRPDAAIDAVEKLRQTHILNIDIASMENASDIRIYFELGLRPLRAQRGWPSVDPIQKFVILAGGLFVWAAIVTEFLLESDTLSEEIELILNGTRWEDNPEKRLAQMYYIILEKAYLAGRRENHFRLFLSVLGTIMVVREPQSDLVIGHLAAGGVRYEHLRRILEGLSATLHIPPESPVVRATHPSFYRYLTNDCKDPRFAVETGAHSRRLGQRCLTIISQKVHRDMCSLTALSDVPQDRILDLPDRISKCIPQEVQYVCKNWVFHIIADSDIFVDSQTENLLTEFFRLQLLPWMEVMGLLDSLLVAHESLDSLNAWLKKFKPPDHILVESVTDALTFLREFHHVISKNAIQVHVSALQFTPRSTTIWKNFIELPKRPILVKSGAETKWPSTQLSLGSTELNRRSVSFSPDGRLLAEIGEPDAVGQVPVQIWNLHSFALVYMIKWYLPAPIGQFTQPKLVFSLDSETLIVLNLHSVRCWSFTQNHEPDIYTILNDAEHTAAAIAPDGSTFALGSPNHNIEIWQVKPRIRLHKDKEIGYGCPLSLSGTGLLYGLEDLSASHSNRVLKCWHADTGLLVNIPDSQSYQQLLSKDGLLVLLISAEHVSVHDSNTGAMLFQKYYYELYDQSGTLDDAALSPDATHLAVAIAEDGDIPWIHIIEVKSGCLKAAYPGTTPFAWSPSSTTLVFQDRDGVIFLWERSTNNDMVLTLSGHRDNQSSSFVISPDGHLLIPHHIKGEIPLLVLTSYTKSNTPQLRFSTDGPNFVNKNGETALLGIMTGSSPLDDAIDDNPDSRYSVTAFVISLNGRLIATLSDSGLVTVYDGYTGEEEGTFQTRLTDANHIQFSSDGNFVAIMFKPITRDFTSSLRSGSRQSEIWSTASRKIVYHSNIFQILQFYPNGHDLVCASFRKALCVNTLNLDKENVRGLEVPLSKDAIRIHSTLAITSHPDAHRLAAIDLDHDSVHVWDTEQHILIGRLEIPQCYEGAPLTDLALSADGRALAATSLNCILIWTLELDADLLLPTLVNHESFAHPRPHFPKFSPDSQMLTYTSNNTQKLWDVVQCKFLPIKHSTIDNLWTSQREWYGDHHYCILEHPRILGLYCAQDMTGFPEAVEGSERLRCTNADGFTGIFSQPGLEVSVPSYKLPISPILLQLNELQDTVSWYWIQKDGRLVLLELPIM